MAEVEVKVPDIGDFKDVPVITVFVKPGDTVKKDDPLLELESDKATMEVPSPVAGKVASVKVKEGDKVAEGTVILTVEAAGAAAAATATSTPRPPVSARTRAVGSAGPVTTSVAPKSRARSSRAGSGSMRMIRAGA